MNLDLLNIEKHRLKSYASVFSSSNFRSLLNDNDYSFLNSRLLRFDQNLIGNGIYTYFDYIKFISREIKKKYRHEYFYKNTLINDQLIGQYGLKDSIIINEFRVGSSIADMTMFNGSSKIFEVKTELDSKARLFNQLQDYKRLFQECYLVVSESETKTYSDIDQTLGIIVLKKTVRSYRMEEVRKPIMNKGLDVEILMRSIRSEEYKAIVKKWYGELPPMTSFEQFNVCSELMSKIPSEALQGLFTDQMKKRKSNTPLIKTFAKELRQLALALKLNKKQYELLEIKLKEPIII